MTNLGFTKSKGKMISIVGMLILSIAFQKLYAQSQPEEMPLIFKNWQILGESKKHIDVFYSVIKCGNTSRVYLKVFNETNKDQTLKFKVEIIDTETGEKIAKEFALALTQLQILKGECTGPNSASELKIDLPASFNPLHISPIISIDL